MTTLNVVELKERLKNVRSDCAMTDNHWLLCPSCECGISPTDLDAGRCTNCRVELNSGTLLATRARKRG